MVEAATNGDDRTKPKLYYIVEDLGEVSYHQDLDKSNAIILYIFHRPITTTRDRADVLSEGKYASYGYSTGQG